MDSDEWRGPAVHVCAAASVVRQFKTLHRRKVSFSHHREVLGLPEEEQDRLLQWAADAPPPFKTSRGRHISPQNRVFYSDALESSHGLPGGESFNTLGNRQLDSRALCGLKTRGGTVFRERR